MIFKGFEIHAIPKIEPGSCPNCRWDLRAVSNGFFSKAFFCSKCEGVYLIELRKAPKNKVSEEFLEQCRKEIPKKEGK